MISFISHTPLVWISQSYWRDEAFSVILAQKPLYELLVITAKDFSPPLYPVILKYWMILFGSGEIATRLFSTLCLVAMVAIIYVYGLKIQSQKYYKIGFVTISILLSPILTYYAFETRMYSIAAFLATASWLTLLKRKKRLFIFFTVLGLYTHYSNIFVMISQIMYVLLAAHLKNNDRSGYMDQIKTYYKEFVVAIALFLPWMLFFVVNHTGASLQSFWIKKPTLSSLLNLPAILLTGYEKDFGYAYSLTFITISVYALLLVLTLYKSRVARLREFAIEYLPFVMWFILPGVMIYLIGLFGPSLFLPRYLIVSTPAFYVLSIHTMKNKSYFWIMVIFFVVIQLQLVNYQQIQIKSRKKEDIKKIFTQINIKTKSNDVLYLESELDFHLAQVYFKYPERVYIVGKPYSELPAYVGKSLIPENKVSIQRPNSETGHWLMSDRSTPNIVK